MVRNQCDCERPKSISDVEEEFLKSESIKKMVDFFKIFGDDTRIRILWTLRSSEMCVQGLSECIGMSTSVTSHQLKTLKEADLVKTKRQGKNIYYSLCDEHIKFELNTALKHIQERKE